MYTKILKKEKKMIEKNEKKLDPHLLFNFLIKILKKCVKKSILNSDILYFFNIKNI